MPACLTLLAVFPVGSHTPCCLYTSHLLTFAARGVDAGVTASGRPDTVGAECGPKRGPRGGSAPASNRRLVCADHHRTQLAASGLSGRWPHGAGGTWPAYTWPHRPPHLPRVTFMRPGLHDLARPNHHLVGLSRRAGVGCVGGIPVAALWPLRAGDAAGPRGCPAQ
eukprot:3408964-Pyramimonas_sp.AAC.1